MPASPGPPIFGDTPLWMIGHGALYQVRHYFQALGYALGSLADRAGPSVGDGANYGNAGCFADDTIKDDDSPQASHAFLYHDNVAPTWVCFIFGLCRHSCTLQTLPHGGPDMYVLFCHLVGLDCILILPFGRLLDCIFILPLGRLQTCTYYIAPQWALMYDIASRQASNVCVNIASWQALHVCLYILLVGRLECASLEIASWQALMYDLTLPLGRSCMYVSRYHLSIGSRCMYEHCLLVGLTCMFLNIPVGRLLCMI